jgi:AhpD family alkylhydroperoxidase
VASVYAQVARDFAIVPPITIHSAVPEILAGVWCMTREAFIVGRAGRARREMVAAAVSRTNECPYCVEVHSAMLHATRDHDLARRLSSDAGAEEAAQAEPLIRWALSTRDPHAPMLADPPFSPAEAPQILGTAAAFHFINRMVSIFLENSPVPGPMRAAVLKPLMGRILGATLGKRMTGVDAKPGLSLPLLPDAGLPPQFLWAAPDPAVAGAIARMASVIESQGAACLPEAARDAVRTRVAAWTGEDPGLGLQWLEQTLAPLAREKDRAAARLALLAALAAYRVDDATIASFRKHFPEDRQLVAAAAWGSFEAVKRLSKWIAGPSAKSSMPGGEAMQYEVNR